MEGRYAGEKKIQITHLDSGATITTAAPIDNQGDGSSFSPTDLLTSSLGACMLTIISIVAERDAVAIEGSYFTVEKIMSQSPRRIGEIQLAMYLPKSLTEEQRRKFEQAAKTCPVHYTLHPDTKVECNYLYEI